MIVHICTAKQEYLTDIAEGLKPALGEEFGLDPHKTCEIFRLTHKTKDGGVAQDFILMPMENPRTGDVNRIVCVGTLRIIPVSCVQLNERGPLARDYYKEMGNSIISATQMPESLRVKDTNKYRPLKVN